jgi:hypothetical protein
LLYPPFPSLLPPRPRRPPACPLARAPYPPLALFIPSSGKECSRASVLPSLSTPDLPQAPGNACLPTYLITAQPPRPRHATLHRDSAQASPAPSHADPLVAVIILSQPICPAFAQQPIPIPPNPLSHTTPPILPYPAPPTHRQMVLLGTRLETALPPSQPRHNRRRIVLSLPRTPLLGPHRIAPQPTPTPSLDLPSTTSASIPQEPRFRPCSLHRNLKARLVQPRHLFTLKVSTL